MSTPDPTEPLMSLIDRYWSLAYQEGKEGRDHDTEAGDAAECLRAIQVEARRLSSPPPAVPRTDGAPAEIWLQLHGDEEPDGTPVDCTQDEVSWCWHQIHEHDVRYVLASVPPEPATKALEFAEYMAKRAEQLLAALESEDEAHIALNESDSDEPEYQTLDDAHCRAIEVRTDYVRGLRSGIYEFRKRASMLSKAINWIDGEREEVAAAKPHRYELDMNEGTGLAPALVWLKPSEIDPWRGGKFTLKPLYTSLPAPAAPKPLSDEQIDRIGYTAEDGDLEKTCDLIHDIAVAETNGEALASVARFRKECRMAGVRAALSHPVGAGATLSTNYNNTKPGYLGALTAQVDERKAFEECMRRNNVMLATLQRSGNDYAFVDLAWRAWQGRAALGAGEAQTDSSINDGATDRMLDDADARRNRP